MNICYLHKHIRAPWKFGDMVLSMQLKYVHNGIIFDFHEDCHMSSIFIFALTVLVASLVPRSSPDFPAPVCVL